MIETRVEADTLIAFLKEFFWGKISTKGKFMKKYPACKESGKLVVNINQVMNFLFYLIFVHTNNTTGLFSIFMPSVSKVFSLQCARNKL